MMTEQTTVGGLISKFWLELAEKNGQPAIRVHTYTASPTKADVAAITAAKTEIIAELQRRDAEKAACEAAKAADDERELVGILDGSILIKPSYHDGEYLSGWQVYGQAADLLDKIGIAPYISGWGHHMPDQTIKALGPEFTYQAAVEYMRPAKEAADKEAAVKKTAIETKFAEAKETGKPVVLRRWSEDCCDPSEECSCDNHREYAMPDGSTKHEWEHTW